MNSTRYCFFSILYYQQKSNQSVWERNGKILLESDVLSHFSCVIFCDLRDHSLPGFSVHGIFQAGILEWVAMPFSRGSSQSKDQTQVSCIYQLIYPGSPIWYTWSSIQVLWIIIGLQGKSNSSVSNLKHYLIFCWKITS